MFQFGRFPPIPYVFRYGSPDMTLRGFPHSDIRGSRPICGSPRLFAAYRVLLRLPAPRHPPYALSSLIFFAYPRAFDVQRHGWRYGWNSRKPDIERNSKSLTTCVFVTFIVCGTHKCVPYVLLQSSRIQFSRYRHLRCGLGRSLSPPEAGRGRGGTGSPLGAAA